MERPTSSLELTRIITEDVAERRRRELREGRSDLAVGATALVVAGTVGAYLGLALLASPISPSHILGILLMGAMAWAAFAASVLLLNGRRRLRFVRDKPFAPNVLVSSTIDESGSTILRRVSVAGREWIEATTLESDDGRAAAARHRVEDERIGRDLVAGILHDVHSGTKHREEIAELLGATLPTRPVERLEVGG